MPAIGQGKNPYAAVPVRAPRKNPKPRVVQPNPDNRPAPRRRPAPRHVAPTRPARPTRSSSPRPSPDAQDAARLVRHPNVSHVSPDAADVAGRSARQHAHDRTVSAHTIAAERLAYLRERERARPSLASRAGHALGSVIQTSARLQGAAPTRTVSPAEAARLRARGERVYSSTQQRLGATVLPHAQAGVGAMRAGEATVLGISRDPKHAIPATLKGFKDAALGIPGATVKLVTDPRGTLTDQAKDYGRRYGGINEPGGVERMARRISKEGAAPEIFDLTSVGVPVSKGLDLGLGGLARAGKLGGRLERTATRARPLVRVSGGKTVEQRTPKGLVRAAAAHRRDRAAAAAVQRQVDRADGKAAQHAARDVEGASKGEPPLTDVRRPKGPVDVVVREAHGRGEIVPTRRSIVPGRRVVSARKLAKAQRRGYATAKGRRLTTQRNEQRTEIFRGSNRRLAGLSRWERRAFKTAMQTGALTPEAARTAIERRINIIRQARDSGRDVTSSHDELPTLQRLHEHAHEAFTPKLAQVVRKERAAAERDAIGDPGLGRTPTERAKSSEARRAKPQAQIVGVSRHGTPVDEAVRQADRGVKDAQKQRDKVVAVRNRAREAAAHAKGYAQHGADQTKRAMDKQIARLERTVEKHRQAAERHRERAQVARQEGTRLGHEHKAQAADERAARAQARLDALRAGRQAARPQYRRSVMAANRRAATAERAAGRANEAVRTAGQTARMVRRQKRQGVDLIGAEPIEEFHGRVRAAAGEMGLETPGYFPSRKRETRRFSPFTVGGARRVKADRKYEGKVFEAGRESNDVTTYTQGRASNIKRKHNWGLIADTINEHALPWGRGLRVGQALDELDKRGVDPDSVRLVDMDAFDRAAHEAGLEGGDVRPTEGAADAELHDALLKAVHGVDVGGHGRLILRDGAHLEPGGGRVMVMLRHVADEILSDTKPSSAAMRSLEIVKGKQARIMLGLSPAWLQFQVGANGLQTLAATRALPHEWVVANLKWWKGLSEGERRALEPVVGIGSFHDSVDKAHLGAAATGGLVDAYRAFKAHPFWHAPRKPLRGAAISQMNPLDTLFRLDNAQNNFFRRAVLYNQLKRQAYENMGRSMLDHQRVIDRVLGTAGKDATQQIRAMIHDPAELERAAEHLHDFLGDYQTYTAKERRVLGRNIMFYGYLRWSLRFAFYTMPVKHPVMTAILGQMGNLQTREVRTLLGGDELPFDLGKLYFTKNGKLASVDLSRANPFLNAVTQTKVGEQGLVRGALASALSVLPPVYGAAADVLFAKSAFRDRPLKVEGETTARPNKTGDRISDVQAVEVFTKEMLDLAAPYRAAEQISADGRPVSDNSLLFRQRYTQFKDPQRRLDVIRGQKLLTTGQRIQQQFLPLVPQPSNDVQQAATVRRARGVASAGAAVKLTPAERAETRAMMREAHHDAGGSGGASKSEIKSLLAEARAAGG